MNFGMGSHSALESPRRVKPYAVVIVATVTLFVENVTRSYQHSVREETVLTARTTADWVVSIGGTYLVFPGLLFVLLYVMNGLEPQLRLTGRLLLGVFAGVLAGSLLGQFVGGAPHPLVFLLTSETLTADPVILRLWLDVLGPISRDFLAVVGILVLVQMVGQRG